MANIRELAVIAAVGLAVASQASAQPVMTTVKGTIMCHQDRHSGQYSTACSESTRYVLVTVSAAYDIKHQEFSGLRQLVGSKVKVVGEVKGHGVDIFQIEVDAHRRDADAP
jgi:hypothetical protein